MLYWEVAEVYEDKTKLVHSLTKEEKILNYEELTKFTQKLYNQEQTLIRGVIAFLKYNQKSTNTSVVITRIVPANEIAEYNCAKVDPIYIPDCSMTNQLYTHVAIPTYSYPFTAPTSEKKEVYDLTSDTSRYANALTMDYQSRMGHPGAANIQFVGTFQNIKWFNYLPICFTNKNGVNSIITCLHVENRSYTYEHIRLIDLYEKYKDYVEHDLSYAGDLYRTYFVRKNGTLWLNDMVYKLNFSAVWMVDKYHIALKTSKYVTVIDISDYINNREKYAQNKSAELRYKITAGSQAVLSNVVLSEDNKVLKSSITTRSERPIALPPTVTTLKNGCIYNEHPYNRIALNTNITKIESGFITSNKDIGVLIPTKCTYGWLLLFTKSLIKTVVNTTKNVYVSFDSEYVDVYFDQDTSVKFAATDIIDLAQFNRRLEYYGGRDAFIYNETITTYTPVGTGVKNIEFLTNLLVSSIVEDIPFVKDEDRLEKTLKVVTNKINKSVAKIDMERLQASLIYSRNRTVTYTDRNKDVIKALNLPEKSNLALYNIDPDFETRALFCLLPPKTLYKIMPLIVMDTDRRNFKYKIAGYPNLRTKYQEEIDFEEKLYNILVERYAVKTLSELLKNIHNYMEFS